MSWYRIAFQSVAGQSWGDVTSLAEARTHAARLLGTNERPGDAYGAVQILEYRDGRFVQVEIVRRGSSA